MNDPKPRTAADSPRPCTLALAGVQQGRAARELLQGPLGTSRHQPSQHSGRKTVPRFTGGEAETQKGKVTCPRPHFWRTVEPRCESRAT